MSATLKQQMMSSRMTNNKIRIATVSLLPAVWLDVTRLKNVQDTSVNNIHRDDIWRKICVVSLNQQHKHHTVSVFCPNGSSHVCCLLSETVALSVIICPVPPRNFQKSSSTTQSPCTPRTRHWNLTRTPVTSITAQSAPLMSGILTGQMRFCIKGNVSLDAISSTALSFAVMLLMRLTQLWSWQEITRDKVG